MISKMLKYTFIACLFVVALSCEKEEDRVYLVENAVAPELTTIPNLSLQVANAADTLTFIATAVEPGFQASAKYILEATISGESFDKPVSVVSANKPDELKVGVKKFNDAMLRKFPANQPTNVDFRVRAVLVVDAGTGALGSSTNPLEYVSQVKTANVTLFPK
ncbi:MAG TPA: SusE domain-containing protein [Prolixibacteraceae bacterium]|nr:SusE domain-containing protein [Prolixibacteraceae bacterium]